MTLAVPEGLQYNKPHGSIFKKAINKGFFNFGGSVVRNMWWQHIEMLGQLCKTLVDEYNIILLQLMCIIPAAF